jgi:hypothetical protein
MDELDNPAGRLHAVLSKIAVLQVDNSSYRIGVGEPITLQTVGDVLRSVLGLSDDASIKDVFRDLLELHKLTEDVERIMRAIASIDEDLHLEPLENIRKFLVFENLSASWSNRRERLDKGDLKALTFCSRAISKSHFGGTEHIPQEELDELTEEVQSLYKKVNDSSLNFEIKSIILDQLEIIRRALHDYRIRGVSSLREALERNIGVLVLNKSLFDEAGHAEVSEFKVFLGKFANVVAFASHATAIAERAGIYLLS